MQLLRAMISVLVAVAIALAPMLSAWAAGATVTGLAMAHTVSYAVDGDGSVAASPMEHCASMMKDPANHDDCPSCDKDKACPPQSCMAKCFQFLALTQQLHPFPVLVTAPVRPAPPAHPPDWSDKPQPPPPRA